jgi:PAS domain S-box-containing protein
VFTLEGAEHAYRVLIESMNEGALTLTGNKAILYANQCFARMVKCPLEQVTGSSFRRFLSAADRATLRRLIKQSSKPGSKTQVFLHASDGSLLPVQISVREMSRESSGRVTIGMVVTDMTEARRTEALLRALTHRVVQVQEAERGRVALELHDNITQLLCAVVFRSQALAESLSTQAGQAKDQAIELRDMLSHTTEEVERISRDLRPSVLDLLGLVAILRDTAKEFANRTGIAVKLSCLESPERLPVDTELALYRIFQEALKNVEQHSRARHVTVRLKQGSAAAHLMIKDDGIGFNMPRRPAKENGWLGLLSMRERATYVGGTLTIESNRRTGTEVEVRIPLPPRVKVLKSKAAA